MADENCVCFCNLYTKACIIKLMLFCIVYSEDILIYTIIILEYEHQKCNVCIPIQIQMSLYIYAMKSIILLFDMEHRGIAWSVSILSIWATYTHVLHMMHILNKCEHFL